LAANIPSEVIGQLHVIIKKDKKLGNQLLKNLR